MIMERCSSAAKGPGAVKTKRGFNIIKQKHQGLAFVNSSSVNEKSQTWSEFSKPLPPTMKFVAQKNVAGNKRRRSRVPPSNKDSDSDEVLSQTSSSSSSRKQPVTRKTLGRTTRSGLNGSETAVPQLGCNGQGLGNNQDPVVDDINIDKSLWDFFEYYDLGGSNFDLEASSTVAFGNEPNWLIPNWMMNTLPNGPSEESKLYLRAYAAVCPGHNMDMNSYQIELSREEINPQSADGISAMQCASALATLYKQFKTGIRDEQYISFHYGGLCSLVGQLLNGKQQARATEEAKARCISLLAILASLLGRYDDWNIHMRGLKHFVESSGGQGVLTYQMLAVVRKADLTGAFELGTEPMVDFQLFCVPMSVHLSVEESNQARFAVRQALSGCVVNESIIDILQHLATTTIAVSQAAMGNPNTMMDYPALMEDYNHLEHRLMSLPGATRDRTAPSQSVASSSRPSICSSDDGSEAYFPSWVQDETARVGCDASFEAALAVAALVYLKVLNMPNNDNILSFINALGSLAKHLQNILDGLHEEAFDAVIEPSLIGTLTPSSSSIRFSREGARPALIWMCLAADHLVRACDVGRYSGPEVVADWTTVFRELLAEVVGPFSNDLDSITVGDLEMCRLFDFGRAMNQQWDLCHELRQMLPYRDPKWDTPTEGTADTVIYHGKQHLMIGPVLEIQY